LRLGRVSRDSSDCEAGDKESPVTEESPKTVLQFADVSVRELSLAAGEVAPWHYHSEVTDFMYCLCRRIALETETDALQILKPGERADAAPGQVHRVVNLGDAPARYLLVQGIGRYDFNVVD
jgi:quercetin dioxygenase-like cupin family protein